MTLYLVLNMSYAYLLCVVLLPYPGEFLLKIMHPHTPYYGSSPKPHISVLVCCCDFWVFRL